MHELPQVFSALCGVGVCGYLLRDCDQNGSAAAHVRLTSIRAHTIVVRIAIMLAIMLAIMIAIKSPVWLHGGLQSRRLLR